MTDQELRDLDARVHREVMGLPVTTGKYGHHFTDEVGLMGLLQVPRYSTDIAAAWRVKSQLIGKGYVIRIETVGCGASCTVFIPGQTEAVAHSVCLDQTKDTAPLVICLAALRAVATQSA